LLFNASFHSGQRRQMMELFERTHDQTPRVTGMIAEQPKP